MGRAGRVQVGASLATVWATARSAREVTSDGGILEGVEPRGWRDGPGQRVVRRALSIASESNERCQPVHLLAALAEVQGPLATILKPARERWLYPRAEPPSNLGGGTGYLASQAVQAATRFATDRQEPFAAGHLAVAVIDQADTEVVKLLRDAHIGPARVRAVALETLRAPPGLIPLPLPPLCPAGTADRPALPVEDLDPPAWSVLSWRQEHLPLGRLKRQSDWYALSHLEHRAAWRIADRRHLDDDQRYSLLSQHRDRVEALARDARPDLVETRRERMQRYAGSRPLVTVPMVVRKRRPTWRRVFPSLVVGWPSWFANRRTGLRDSYFRLVTAPAYRGQPAIKS